MQVNLHVRPRRNRSSKGIRQLLGETSITASDLIWPLFVEEGKNKSTAIAAMPGQFRYTPDLLVQQAKKAFDLGISAVALFPAVAKKLKDARASEAMNPNGLLPQTVRRLKDKIPELVVITDVAMDPYSSDGHDGYLVGDKIDNDLTLEILAAMAVTQANAGADMVAPSDMMDGRVGYIRKALDENGHTGVGILSYTAKYASCFYGPFRTALDSAPKRGDKKTYQMNPANAREALREARLDEAEGADILMVKPGLPYLDIIQRLRSETPLPIAAYQVSGEYAMLVAASQKGWLDLEKAVYESLICLKRAGADVILTYFAMQVAEWLKKNKFE